MKQMAHIDNPKRSQLDSPQSRWYPYYAGFSETFAETALSSARLGEDDWVLDPWNGSGTTTSRAISLGFNSYGFDLNPVMVIVAMARSLDPAEYPSLRPLSVDISSKARKAGEVREDDPLLTWLVPSSVGAVRAIECAIQRLLVNELTYARMRQMQLEKFSDLAAFFYVALFRVLRRVLSPFLTSNPTWTKMPRTVKARLRPSGEEIRACFKRETEQMIPSLPAVRQRSGSGKKIFAVASSERLPMGNECVDFVLGSPPYCTRIDYAIATSVELSLLGYSPNEEFNGLRRRLIGNTTVPKSSPSTTHELGTVCLRFLEKLAEHPSKASSTYYLKNHLQYFHSIRASLAELSRVVKPNSCCVLVVQDSFYKDLHNDLPAIFIEIASKQGLALLGRRDFPLSRTMARVNPRVKDYRESHSAVESVLSFTKCRD